MSREGKPVTGTSEWEDATRPTVVVGMPREWDRIARGESSRPSDGAALQGLEKLSATVAQELSPPAKPVGSETVENPSDESESLQSHLDRFLERMTGKSRPAESKSATEVEERTAAVTPVIERAPREPAAAPERRDQMAALRELANQSARDAVVLHVCRMLVSRSRKILFAALAATLVSSAFAAGAIVFQLPGAKHGALLTGGIALVLSCWFYGSCRTLRRQVALLDPHK
jgi:hypothetical protein